MKTDLSPRAKVALYGLLCTLAIPFVFPTWWMVTSSVKPISDIFAFPPEIIPRAFDWSTYEQVFQLQPFAQQYWNSCYIAAIVTIGTLVVSSFAGYAFARIKFPGAMAVGDELSVYVELLKQGRTSLKLRADAIARERDGDSEKTVAEGEFTFVALDANDKPQEIAAKEEDHG